MKRSIIALLFALFMIPATSQATEYEQFKQDMMAPYGLYKKSLSLTSKAENRDKAIEVVEKYIKAWQKLADTYGQDVPTPFSSMNDFPAIIARPVAVGQSALTALQEDKVKESHVILEEVRYLLWNLRTQAGIVSLNDKINDFHEAMEIVLDGMKENNSTGALQHLGSRYGAWLAIKWEEVAAQKMTGKSAEIFNKAVSDGREAIASLRKALTEGDAEKAGKIGNQVKNAYKAVFFLPECS